MNNDFMNRLNQALQLRNMKAIELSEKTGISKARISQYVNGVYTPKSKGTYAIAKALNVNETWLMGYDVPMENSETTIPQAAGGSIDNDEVQLTPKQAHLLKLYNSLPPEKKKLVEDLITSITESK